MRIQEDECPGSLLRIWAVKSLPLYLFLGANQCFEVATFHTTALQEQRKSILDAQHFNNTDSFEPLPRQLFRKQTLRFPHDVDPSSSASIFAKFYPDWLFRTITDNTSKKAEKLYQKHTGEGRVWKGLPS